MGDESREKVSHFGKRFQCHAKELGLYSIGTRGPVQAFKQPEVMVRPFGGCCNSFEPRADF